MLNFRRDAEVSARLQNLKISYSNRLRMALVLRVQQIRNARANVTLKIERYSDGAITTIRLIGRMRAEHVMELEQQIAESESTIVLDLEEVKLVDVEAVRFLGSCEVAGVTLLNCAPYIRDWIGKERD
jgi:division protein CdvB (Snf7/Vps24/ESCRT-III family)